MRHQLPTGTVTFVFTDVEGSTRLLKQLRERYGEGLDAHQRLLREAFSRHGGLELDTQGDSFFYAFPRARNAVLAALDGQRVLHGHADWPGGAAFKVRMGVHTGQAEISNGRYTGLAVHRAARICAAAHGGQVLVSQATETLLADEEEDLEINFRPLGSHRLKDLDRPVSLYQAGASDLPSKFPPPREQQALALPWLRRPITLISSAIAVAAIAVITIALLIGGGGGGLSGVDANNVGVIDPKTNKIVAQVPTGIRPGPIAAGAGSVWVGNRDEAGGTLTRIDAVTRKPVAFVTLENRTPTGVAVSSDAVWVAHGLLGSVTQVDPRYNRRVLTVGFGEGSYGGDAGAVASGGGAVWAVFGNSVLIRINPSRPLKPKRGFAGSAPSGIAYAGGAVWVTNSGNGIVDRFDPETFTSGPVGTHQTGLQPSSIAYGDGALWVTNQGEGTVTRIGLSFGSGTQPIEVGLRPSAIAVGGGAVWVTNSGDGTVSRIDPETRKVTKTIHTGNFPAGVVVSNGFVWVTVQEP